jgi:hypothetical protein
VKSYYEKNRGEVIAEVRRKVYDIASGYDELINHHAACSYCEHRCKYYDKVTSFIDTKVATDKVLEKWAVKNYSPGRIASTFETELFKKAEFNNEFEKRCAIGYILSKKNDLNDGQRQKIIAEYLRYINNR